MPPYVPHAVCGPVCVIIACLRDEVNAVLKNSGNPDFIIQNDLTSKLEHKSQLEKH